MNVISATVSNRHTQKTFIPANRLALHNTVNRLLRKARANALVPPSTTFPNVDNFVDIFGVFGTQSVKNRLVEHFPTELLNCNVELNCNFGMVWCNELYQNINTNCIQLLKLPLDVNHIRMLSLVTLHKLHISINTFPMLALLNYFLLKCVASLIHQIHQLKHLNKIN